jgi:SAM-dependent methyltransferase
MRHLLARIYRRIFPPKIPSHPFDLRHQVDTSGLLYAPAITSGHPHDRHNTAYWGTAPSLFHGALARWQESLAGTPYTLADYTLIDIGSGKGRVVFLASEYPFRRILGVELNPNLTAIAGQNLARWQTTPHACADIAFLQSDALAVDLPETPTLLYLFNPFDAHVMQLLLTRLQSAARFTPIDLIYTRPEHATLFDTIPGMTLLWKGEVPFTPEDTAADAFSTTQQNTNIYRLQPSA